MSLLDQTMSTMPEAHVFVLIDGCLLEDAPRQIRKQFPVSQAHSLLIDERNPQTIAAGALLFDVTHLLRENMLHSALTELMQDQPMASILVSQRTAPALVLILSKFIDIRLENSTAMVMRFYDGRILPFWWDQIEPSYRQILSDEIAGWFYLDHTLQLQDLPRKQSERISASPTFPMRLTQQQEFALIDASFPYTLAAIVSADNPNALHAVTANCRYDFFKQQLLKAKRYGVDEGNALQSFCNLAVQFGHSFDAHPHFSDVWKAVHKGVRFEEALQQLTELQWVDIQKSKTQFEGSYV